MNNGIAIIDYGMGNLHSVKKKLDRLKKSSFITSDPDEIFNAEKIILVGVGHFRNAMKNLKDLNLIEPLNNYALIQKKPILGICLGMQLMANTSEEGHENGLGWIEAEIVKMKVNNTIKYKVPHTGWNEVFSLKPSPLMKGISDGTEFYFVHSYYCKPHSLNTILNETEYAFRFTSAIEKDNIFGVQYHPEKSHDAGNQLLTNFIEL
jgi:glutamine amidotransferase|tara:strand:- start:655 stop:1275 length:621 start_codon:yes stop_codon:yes gene_type:complete